MTSNAHKLYLYSYDKNSQSAKDLAKGLKINKIRNENSIYKDKESNIVINWGSTTRPSHLLLSKIINPFEQVARITNKLSFFEFISKADPSVRLVPWTKDLDHAVQWFKEGNKVCARTILNSSSARGLVVLHPKKIDTWVKAPLYTRYISKKEEYRIHFAFTRIIDIQRKIFNPDLDKDEANWEIRNHENGFIFVRNDIKPAEDVLKQAELVAKASGLDFGAIDVIWNEKNRKAYILEINTAPGLAPTTLANYIEVFKELLN
jgi:glutathione synthase/RimK-type ligase-like ATP-grasp enzyme